MKGHELAIPYFKEFQSSKVCRTVSPLILACLCGFVLSWASSISERICCTFSWDLVSLLQLSTGKAAMTMVSLTRIMETTETKREQC